MNRRDDSIETLAAKARREPAPDWPVRIPRVVLRREPVRMGLALWASGAGSALAAAAVLSLAVLMPGTTTASATTTTDAAVKSADPTAAMFSPLDVELP